MKQVFNRTRIKKNPNHHTLPSIRPYRQFFICLLLGVVLWSCSDFVEVDPPKNILVSSTVFEDPSTVRSALANIYYRMREQGMVSGTFGITTGLGIYGDELDYYAFNVPTTQLYQHTVLPSNNTVLGWWSNAYGNIYAANDIINGIENSTSLTVEERNRFKGQALFVRAYMHSLLVSLFGDVPYITTTDYLENNEAERLSAAVVNEAIINDLEDAIELLEGDDTEVGERVVPDQYVAKALLSRMYLYTENWESAEAIASDIIGAYSLEADVRQVFLKESQETIWHLKPGEIIRNTHEANQLIIQAIPGQTYALTNSLLDSFEPGDMRLLHWTKSISDADSTVTLHYAHKYKANFSVTESLEYSIIFRLGEQYLIRAEARVRSGNLSGAREDLDAIRNRAGLNDTPARLENQLLDAIYKERRVELFTENGQRWFDLKRTERAQEVLPALKPGWRPTDVLLPVPEMELQANTNLLPQNPGY
ncbi:RagB/SusD family nutrient uptake outer membrane protein [Maribacter litoralis]|uniref:RagB/SusD family nutrient uptake outer membrane protein n=1 Tax=Maribacter litoralis TaxID=2059726 RepID=UPI003F5CC89D